MTDDAEKVRARLAVKIKALVDSHNDELPMLAELATMKVQRMRIYYLAFVKEGFTEQQALDLCWRVA